MGVKGGKNKLKKIELQKEQKQLYLHGKEYLVFPYREYGSFIDTFAFPVNGRELSTIVRMSLTYSEYTSLKASNPPNVFYADFDQLKDFLIEQNSWRLFAIGTVNTGTILKHELQTHLFFIIQSNSSYSPYRFAEYVFANGLVIEEACMLTTSLSMGIPGFLQVKDSLSETNWKFMDEIKYRNSGYTNRLCPSKDFTFIYISEILHQDITEYVDSCICLDLDQCLLITWKNQEAVQKFDVGIVENENRMNEKIQTYEILHSQIDPVTVETSEECRIESYFIGVPKEMIPDPDDLYPVVPQKYVGNLKNIWGTTIHCESLLSYGEQVEAHDGHFIRIDALYKKLENVTFLGIHHQSFAENTEHFLYYLYFKTMDHRFLEVIFSPAWVESEIGDVVFLLETEDPYETSFREMELSNQHMIPFQSVSLINFYGKHYIEVIGDVDSFRTNTVRLFPTEESKILYSLATSLEREIGWIPNIDSSHIMHMKDFIHTGKTMDHAIREVMEDILDDL